MTIRAFIMDEVERQGFTRGTPEFWFRVGSMTAAWRYAILIKTRADADRPRDGVQVNRLTARLVQTLGAMIEPELNVDGWRNCGVTVGGRICPSPVIVPALMNQWANRLKAGEFEPDQAYLAFEEIHPFRDGNGRTGKIIHNWLLDRLDDPVLVKDYFGGGNP